jgi:ABC-type multidrug transport system fused ATPase/permease subunit
MVEAEKGRILIDGVNIQKEVGVINFCRAIAATPQEPNVFEGTFRFNLDLFREKDDDELWDGLERVEMKEKIGGWSKKLDSNVAEDGGNLSVGERQLLCLCRGLLKGSKIILMDEVTAGVDFATDAMIQKVTRSCFRDRTVVTIAHRLSTIADVDIVIVMEKGQLIEMGNPRVYLFVIFYFYFFILLSFLFFFSFSFSFFILFLCSG